MAEENQVIIEEPSQAKEEKAAEFDLTGFTPEEIEIARKHKLIPEKGKEDGEHQELSESPAEKDGEQQAEQKAGKQEKIDPATFEEMEAEEKADLESFHTKYSRNAKGLYNRYKKERLARQENAEKVEQLKAQQDLKDLKVKAVHNKLAKISGLLQGDPDQITVEAIQAIIGSVEAPAEAAEDDKPVTRAELKRLAEEADKKRAAEAESSIRRNSRIVAVEVAGKNKYKDFTALVERANKIVQDDKHGHFSTMLNAAIDNENATEEDIADLVVKIANLAPATPSGKAEEVERIVKNANKQKTSAAITGGSGGRRAVSFEDLTVEDAVKLSPEQWRKVPPEHRRRLLGG